MSKLKHLRQEKYKDQVTVVFNSECVKVEWEGSAGRTVLRVQGTEIVKPTPGGTRTLVTDQRPRRTVTLVGQLPPLV
jgi:hypothetical protein